MKKVSIILIFLLSQLYAGLSDVDKMINQWEETACLKIISGKIDEASSLETSRIYGMTKGIIFVSGINRNVKNKSFDAIAKKACKKALIDEYQEDTTFSYRYMKSVIKVIK